ncbi:sigma-70 family RNA polymerase sigma factor [Catellatospora sp. NPDC049133]|uniref:RNA polymerase sigma factor n=1 Tax=Catellatospora sp. NPDC049133 TaxID=3155499 RepID=UPI00340D3EE6
MRVDQTECESAGGWRFDPADGRHTGWQDAFTVFMRANEDRLLGYVQRLCSGFTQAELDPEHVTQATWEKAMVRWPTVQDRERQRPGGGRAYLYKVAKNLVMRAYLNRRELARVTAVQPGWTSAGQRGRPVADQALGGLDVQCRPEWEDELLDRLAPGLAMSAMHRLPGHQKAATYLAEVEGWKAKEIAAVLGVSAADVRTYTKRGRDNLRQAVGLALTGSAVAVAAVGAVGVADQLLQVLYRLFGASTVITVLAVDAIVVAVTYMLQLVSRRDGPLSARRRAADRMARHARMMPIGRFVFEGVDLYRRVRTRRARRGRAA